MSARRVLLPLTFLFLLASLGVLAGSAQGEATSPTVAIATPVEGATVNGTTTVDGDASSPNGTVDRVEVRIDEGAWNEADGTANWTFTWDTTAVSDGPHTIHARAYDGENVSGTATRNVTVDNQDAKAEISIDHPVEGDRVSGTVTLEGAASDPDDPLDRVEVRIDEGTWQPADGTGTWSFAWDTTSFADGDHVIEARVVSGGEASMPVNVTVQVENEQQPPRVWIDAPAAGASVDGTVDLQGRASDPDGDGITVQVRIDQGAWQDPVGGQSWLLSWDTTSVENGQHTFQARVSDGAATSHSEVRSVTVDNPTASEAEPPATHRPNVSISTPGPGDRVNGTIEVMGSATDEDGDLEGIEVRIDEGGWFELDAGATWSYTWDTTRVPDGSHVIEARGRDSEGTGATVVRIVTVANGEDEPPEPASANEPPALELLSPSDGGAVVGDLLVEGEIEDPDAGHEVLAVEARIDDGAWQGTTGRSGESFRLELTTSDLSTGEHVLTVRVVDGANATDEATRAFTLEKAAGPSAHSPSEASASPMAVGLGTFIVLFLFGAGGLYAWSRNGG